MMYIRLALKIVSLLLSLLIQVLFCRDNFCKKTVQRRQVRKMDLFGRDSFFSKLEISRRAGVVNECAVKAKVSGGSNGCVDAHMGHHSAYNQVGNL